MKSLLTFTLAAGVAITTTSIVHAAGTAKGAAKVERASTIQVSAPQYLGTVSGLALDRSAMNRELNRLNDLLQPTSMNDELSEASVAVGKKSLGGWVF